MVRLVFVSSFTVYFYIRRFLFIIHTFRFISLSKKSGYLLREVYLNDSESFFEYTYIFKRSVPICSFFTVKFFSTGILFYKNSLLVVINVRGWKRRLPVTLVFVDFFGFRRYTVHPCYGHGLFRFVLPTNKKRSFVGVHVSELNGGRHMEVVLLEYINFKV